MDSLIPGVAIFRAGLGSSISLIPRRLAKILRNPSRDSLFTGLPSFSSRSGSRLSMLALISESGGLILSDNSVGDCKRIRCVVYEIGELSLSCAQVLEVLFREDEVTKQARDFNCERRSCEGRMTPIQRQDGGNRCSGNEEGVPGQ